MPNLVKFGLRSCYTLYWRKLGPVSTLQGTQIARRYASKYVKNDTVKVRKNGEKSINKVSGKFISPVNKCPEIPQAPCSPSSEHQEKKSLVEQTKILQTEPLTAGQAVAHFATEPKPLQEPATTGDDRKPPKDEGKDSNRLYWLLLAAILLAGGVGVLQNYNVFDREPSKKAADEEEKKKKLRVPLTSAEIPKEVPYLLIGGGTASFAAFRAIKSHDPKAKVMLITDELEMPYMRPPLSKEIWQNTDSTGKLSFKQWNGVERSLFYEPDEFYLHPKDLTESTNGGVSVVRGYTVDHLDVVQNLAILSDGTEIRYGKVLIAPGSIPKNLDIFTAAPLAVQNKVTTFKNIVDYRHLLSVLENAKSVAIIGGGFLGSELACSVAKIGTGKKIQVFQIFHEHGNLGKVLPEYLCKWTTERVREEGVTVMPGNQVVKAEQSGKQVKLHLIDGKVVIVDHVVVAAGSEPNTLLAKKSNLELHSELGGYIVNTELQARSNVYVVSTCRDIVFI
ncbi:Putative apoptosis-inducing factor 1, mitochondrial [Sergentomyia squamirostris]